MNSTSAVSDDVTALILDDHETFRRLFARLDDAQSVDDARQIWTQLSPLLEAHVVAEEISFYPALLKAAHDTDDVKDMIHDHNEIRDGVHAADRCEVGSDQWWKHVGEARKANSEHMAEEERETLVTARKKMSMEQRTELGLEFLRLRNAYPSGDLRAADHDKDPQEYVEQNG